MIDENADIRREARKKLVEIGEPAVKPLLAKMEVEKGRTQLEIVKALGKLGDPQAVEPLIEALNDPDGMIRTWAGKSLTHIGEPSVNPLIRLSEVGEPEMRRKALSILADIADEKAIDAIKRHLESRDPETRALTVKALALTVNPKTIASLIEALQDPYWPVRLWAAYGLGLEGRKRGTTAPLLKALEDESPHVRAAAVTALGDIGALSAVGPLTRMLRDDDALIRLDAAYALGEIGNLEAVAPLKEHLNDRDPYVRASAAQALGKIGASDAVEPLLEILEDEKTWVPEAVNALVMIGTEEATEGLMELSVKTGDDVLREEIFEALNLSSNK